MKSLTLRNQPMHNLRCLLSAILLSAVAGCGGDNPGEYDAAKVQGGIERTMQTEGITVTTLDLAPKPAGPGFTGTAIDQDGQSYDIDVIQRPEASRLDFTAKGDRGDIIEGKAAL